jgi:hypothetical protein
MLRFGPSLAQTAPDVDETGPSKSNDVVATLPRTRVPRPDSKGYSVKWKALSKKPLTLTLETLRHLATSELRHVLGGSGNENVATSNAGCSKQQHMCTVNQGETSDC